MPPSDDECPLCGADLRGQPIPQEAIDKGYYKPGVTHYSRMIGHQITGVYDGVLYWSCPDCKGKWHRFPEGDHRRALAGPIMEFEGLANG